MIPEFSPGKTSHRIIKRLIEVLLIAAIVVALLIAGGITYPFP